MPSLLTPTAVPRSDGQLRVRQGDARDDRRHADHRADAEAERARALAVTRLDGHHRQPAADQAADVAADRDVRQREREHEVDDYQPAYAGLERVDAACAEVDER